VKQSPAKRCYGWSHIHGEKDDKERFVAVPEIPTVDSALRFNCWKTSKEKMKKWTVGELQALRAAWRFMCGLGSLAIIVSIGLFCLSFTLTPEQLASNVHRNDMISCAVILVVAVAFVVVGWKLRSYVRKCEQESGQSSKPFGWMP